MKTDRLVRSRWAAIGAAVAVTLGSGGLMVANAATSTGTPSSFEALSPARILDTRLGIGVPKAKVGAGQEIELTVVGFGGVLADATSVVLNMTATNGTVGSFITVYPSGETRPADTSVLNVQAGVDTPNMVTVKLGTGGKIRIYNSLGSVDVIADVAGYFHPVASPVETNWGRFDSVGTLQAGTLGINMPKQSTGFYRTTLGGNYTVCGWTVAVNVDNSSTARYAIVDRGAFPTDLYVYVYTAAGTLVDAPFTLVRNCPPA